MDCITFISMLEGFLVLSKVIMVSSKLCSSPQVMFQLTILIVWFAMLLFFWLILLYLCQESNVLTGVCSFFCLTVSRVIQKLLGQFPLTSYR